MSEFTCRLLRYMYATAVPVNDDPGVTGQPLLDFQAGYVLRFDSWGLRRRSP